MWFFPFLVVAVVCSSARADIVGGEDVTESDPVHASTVAIYEPSRDGKGGSLCTGSLIGKDVALTAAHCLQPGGRTPVVLFGRDLHRRGVIARPVTGAKVNARWPEHAGRGMDQGDVAVVKFGGGIPDGYAPVPMASSEAGLKKGARTVLAGFGISDAVRKRGSGRLRKTSVTVADQRRGRSEMILDQSRGRGACHGDSGGPAFARQRGRTVLAGVTNRSYPSRGPDDCRHRVVYTKVSAYRPWISRATRELHRPGTASGYLMAKAARHRLGARPKRRR